MRLQHPSAPIRPVLLGFYQKDFPQGGVNGSLEVYYKAAVRVMEYRDGASFITTPHVETMTLPGDLEAYGLEAYLRKREGKISGWVSCAYTRSYLTVDNADPDERINDGLPFPSNYDRPHNLNVVANWKINRRLSLSGNFVYIKARPSPIRCRCSMWTVSNS
ncbi:MAG: hypothetical protein R2751_11525 [Bacteroidales bacterium]